MEMAMEDVDGGVHEGQAARLSKIRISNFKNYVGDHVIDVARESFVCVFGRNGSGKSCVVDAIAFCLGASTTQLRVKKLASLVNDSVASRDPNAVCSVCVEFSISEQPDLWIKRQVDVRTSATKFLVRDANGDHWKTVSRGVVEDTVKSLGIDMNLQDRFIIRQANATALAQVSSQGLLNFCERVIGTIGLLQEIDELRAKENEALTQCEQLREEVEQLQTERAKSQPMVEKFRKWIYDKEHLRDRIQDESAKLAAIDHHLLDLYQCTKRSLCHEIDLRNEEVMSIQKNLAQQQTEQKTHTAHAHKTEELVAKAKQDYSSIVRRRIALETKIKSVQAELKQREVKGQELRREYDSAIRDEREIDNSVGAHRKLLSELQADYKITQLKQVEKLSATHDKDKHKYEGRLREIAALENALNESIHDKDQKFATFEKAQRALDGTKGIIRQLRRELDACQEEDRKLHDQIEEETRRSQYQKSEITQLKRDLEKDEEQRRLADAKLQTAQLKVDMARASLQTIDTTHIDEMSRQLSRMKACQKELSAPFPEITEFKSEIELIKKVTSCERALENAERRALTVRTQRKYLHDQISALDKNQQVLSGSLGSLLSSLDSTSNREEACKRVLTDHKNALVAVKEKIFQCQKSCLEITNDLERASSQIAEREVKKKVNDKFIAELQRELLQLSPHFDYAEKPLYEAEDIEATKTLRSQVQVSLGLLKEEETVLERVKATISRQAVEDAMRCQEDIMLKEGKVESLRADILRMNERRDSLITTRFSRLVSALRDVNDNLGKIYRVLNEDGECYLGYSLEKATFFDEGLVFNCKPDENHWQHFVGLSGGQQVVCSVSLMLAFQASFSCPFYICDEIDAALDTINVSKLGKLLLQQSEKTKTQFLIVSHRPEMWELCSYLVGIYERDHSACAIACHF
ncbi:hypothetical protein Poli38472_000905 [Pythium oligandrum]|uniref:RecF/RecN/SMC N-terminal domain-containing protein n=1 Tax=Pythium oligandrum TaxID=41045 RepID=A0A8K1CE18_PYTOL|nr:hypothetical protein Poli38472_000905 [Pythium oligandrum]|eukprot:TMW60863.1 hypothetical protein Poli38472_000905 [Pythium oligandrum]